jgi:hypothetical protein
MPEQFPNIEDVDYKEVAPTAEVKQKPPFKLLCEKHGEIPDDYVFRVNMPDFGFDRKTYCLVCAIEYLSMIASEVTYVPNEEKAE